MNIKFNTLLKYRDVIFCVLILLVFITFTISYALNSISVFLFFPFFFFDKKERVLEKWHAIKNNKKAVLFALFFLAQIIGLLYSEDFNLGLKRITVMLPLVFLPAILSVEKLDKERYNKVLCILKYCIPTIFAVYLIVHCFVDGRGLSTFVHFTIKEKIKVSQFYLAFILILPIMESFRQVLKGKRRFVNGIILIVTLGVVLLLGNKTTLLFLSILSLSFMCNLWRFNKKQGVLVMLLVLISLPLLTQVPIIKNRISVFLKTTDFNMETIITKNKFTHTKNTAEHRVLIDYLSVKEIVKSFPFGVGTGDYQNALNSQYRAVNFKAALKNEFNNHNQYLSEFLKTGVLGGVLFLMLLGSLWRTPKNRFGFFYVLFFSLGCLVESYLVRQHGVVILAFIIPFFIKNEIK